MHHPDKTPERPINRWKSSRFHKLLSQTPPSPTGSSPMPAPPTLPPQIRQWRMCLRWAVISALLILNPGCTDKSSGPPTGSIPSEDPSKTARTPSKWEPDQMQVVILGSGTPIPDSERFGPSAAVVANGNAYIVDFGPGVVRRAMAAFDRGITPLHPSNLKTAFATHLHSDHTIGIADLILTPAVIGRRQSLSLIGPSGLEHMAQSTLSGFKADLEIRSAGKSQYQMSGYTAQVKPIVPTDLPSKVFQDRSVSVSAFNVKHGIVNPAFGYRFEANGRVVVFSGDTGPTDAVVQACNGCDVLVHEVYCDAGVVHGPASFQQYHRAHHTSALELAHIAGRAQPKLLVLTHLLLFGCTEDQLLKEIRDNYAGQVALGYDGAVF